MAGAGNARAQRRRKPAEVASKDRRAECTPEGGGVAGGAGQHEGRGDRGRGGGGQSTKRPACLAKGLSMERR